MAITRTPIIDDDGTGTTGTVIDNAWKTELYNQVDSTAAFVNAPNTFSQGQTMLGALDLRDTTAPVDAKTFRIWGSSQLLLVDTVADNGVGQSRPLVVTRPGDLQVARDVYEKGRTTPMGHWITVPFNAGNFTASTGSFTVASAIGLRYMLIGKTLWFMFYFQGTVAGAPQQLRIALPLGTAGSYGTAPFMYGSAAGAAQLSPGDARLNLYRDLSGAVNWVDGAYWFGGTVPIAIT